MKEFYEQKFIMSYFLGEILVMNFRITDHHTKIIMKIMRIISDNEVDFTRLRIIIYIVKFVSVNYVV